MQLNGQNRFLLNEVRRNIKKLTPFVGAGLSIDFGYPSWIGMFNALCESELDPTSNECEEIKTIINKIQNGEELNNEWETFYSRMADIMFKSLGEEGFLSYIENLFKDRNDITEEKIKESATYSVASTFRGLCLTTNLDRIVDKAYGFTGRTDVFSPGQENQIKQLNFSKSGSQNNEFVFHLHGSISDVFSNPERIILTTESYRNYYAKSNKNEFLESLASVALLYLGVNLVNEEPFIHFFNKKLPSNRYHYAIYYASSSEEAQLVYEKLIKQKIKAIIYPTGEYHYVKLIIDWLSKDNPSEIDIKNWLQYTYDNYVWPSLPYIDEQDNIAKISCFLDDLTRFSFIEISGGRWSGKTQLSKEIEKKPKIKTGKLYLLIAKIQIY